MHTTLKNVELLKHFKIKGAAPTCFGLQGNHHQGAAASTWLKLHTRFNMNIRSHSAQHSTHASQVILCSHNTDNVCTTSMYPHWTECI